MVSFLQFTSAASKTPFRFGFSVRKNNLFFQLLNENIKCCMYKTKQSRESRQAWGIKFASYNTEICKEHTLVHKESNAHALHRVSVRLRGH